MLCSRIRTALSARLDGEELPPGLTPGRLDDHLAGCRDCRRWDAQVRALTTGLDRVAAHPADDPAVAGTLLARLCAVSAVPAISGTADAGMADAGKGNTGRGNTGRGDTGRGDTGSADSGGTRTPAG
ncbi:pentapeptide repeat-containing protein [Streptomyces lydicus]|uniref:pentapeptide repeat-containing protein n=1 Tax=Streptomyces lydicus TaxID=47763 RepID=UPI0019D712B3|nr:pentapeptide repeat-containing protein [Streptomyces lydicus]